MTAPRPARGRKKQTLGEKPRPCQFWASLCGVANRTPRERHPSSSLSANIEESAPPPGRPSRLHPAQRNPPRCPEFVPPRHCSRRNRFQRPGKFGELPTPSAEGRTLRDMKGRYWRPDAVGAPVARNYCTTSLPAENWPLGRRLHFEFKSGKFRAGSRAPFRQKTW